MTRRRHLSTVPDAYPHVTDQPGPVRVTRDGAPVSPILPNTDEAFRWLLRHAPMSVSWSLTHEGYAVETIGAQPWDDDTARHERDTARSLFRHEHPPVDSPAWREWIATGDPAGDAEHAEMVRDNCHACALDGYGELGPHNSDPERIGSSGRREPNGAFPRPHIQAGRSIPRRWVPALVHYLNSDDNPSHRDAVARDLATFGVTFTD